jgi:hypothetical protein
MLEKDMTTFISTRMFDGKSITRVLNIPKLPKPQRESIMIYATKEEDDFAKVEWVPPPPNWDSLKPKKFGT